MMRSKKLLSLVLVAGMLVSSVSASADTSTKGIADLSLTGSIKYYRTAVKDSTANSIGIWNKEENDILNGLAVCIDGKWQYAAREWFLDSSATTGSAVNAGVYTFQDARDLIVKDGKFFSGDMYNSWFHALGNDSTVKVTDVARDFSVIPESLIKKNPTDATVTKYWIDNINSAITEMSSVLRFDDEAVPYIKQSSLKGQFVTQGNTARYTVETEVYNLGELESSTTAYVGATGGTFPENDVNSPAGKVVGLITNGSDCSLSQIAGYGQGSMSVTNWDCPSARVKLYTANTISLKCTGGECKVDTTYSYKSGNKWVIDGVLPEPVANDDEEEFLGWYTEEIGGTKVEKEIDPSVKKLYARFGTAEPTSSTTAQAIKVGSVIKTGGVKYKVKTASATSKTGSVVAVGPTSKKAKKITIAGSLVTKGYTLRVTEVKSSGFKGMTKLTNVTIGSKVQKIGTNAFKGDKKLKKVTIKTTALKSVGKGAFKGTHKKCKFVVPSGYATKYSKMLKK